jgi:hypothetical protein
MSDLQNKVNTKDKCYIHASYRKGIFIYHNYVKVENNQLFKIIDHNIMKSKL